MRQRHLNKSVSRRDILRFSMAGAGLAALGPLTNPFIRPATGAPENKKRVIVIYAYGGYDGLNLLVPYTNNAYYDRRTNTNGDTIAIQAANVQALNGNTDYGFHPNFDQLAGLYNDAVDGGAAAFRMVGYPSQNLSHFVSQDIYSHGVRGDFGGLPVSESGWIARVANEMNFSATGAVAVNVGRPLDVEGGNVNPLLVSSLGNFRINQSDPSADNHEHRMQVLTELLQSFSGSTLDAEGGAALEQGLQLVDSVQTAVSSYTSTVTYPNTTPSRYLQDMARLIQGGFDSQVFFTGIGGWDTHSNQGNEAGNQANLITRVDDAIGAFAQDMKDMGQWDNTLILVASEFGRRNFMNAGLGTDHGHGNMFFAAGGGVNAGVYGPEVTESDIADNNWLGYGLDFRDIYREAITSHLGGDGDAVFPETQDINTTLNYV